MASKYRLRLAACSGISSGRPFESDVGKKILMKYGWKEGEGLGRLSNGRTAPIQAQRRELKEGLGQEKRKSEDQWDNWWGDVFNSVAKNMTITNSKITVETSGEDSSDEEDAKDRKDGLKITGIKKAGVMQGKLRRVMRQDTG
ncbi:unnamed protein product [Polarella glacialis]|uniref:G-patch domain-containing protein n=1 Tax=Polarella glacialis TaxID=89957 RepID=A0A813F6J9_POLGL|nr:unnamed protein product [Polarella glacialis]CAE8694221.1 unnamed protein product [Polarella glacialis]|mmetsp:Transcript_73133/g.117928  ORF Transcript_73133/g.117928 Transcript_73133/m.117928 type:complete len:143 (-) Transcript_73133:243-671(-)